MTVNKQYQDITPKLKESPTEYANRLGQHYAIVATNEHKKDNGQFFTPSEIAHFMASFTTISKEKIKILDPGCGVGILSTAVIEKIISTSNITKAIELVVFETDVDVLPLAERCFEYLRNWLAKRNINFTIFLCKNDFILHNSIILNNKNNSSEAYDIVVSNPPYFKLPKNDERAIAAKAVIYGQTNIYSIFLLIAAKLLKNDGQLIFITPRSFCSGNYFRSFRNLFFSLVDLKAIHLFNSRKSAFKKDKVLQENIIISAESRKEINNSDKKITISTSFGINDLHERSSKQHFLTNLINLHSYQKILHLPSSETDEKIIKIFKTWTGSLSLYSLKISTGPVVDFRSLNMISDKKTKNTVPLIWLHNVESMNLRWPLKEYKGKKKNQYIINDKKSSSRLVKNKNYVFLRRFSTKDDNRRLIAAPYFKEQLSNISMLGIENHLNYIYNSESELTVDQTLGLSAILNSRLFDLYFRTFNGNINVSATELNDFPLPDLHLIEMLGQKIKESKKEEMSAIIDELVSEIFNLPIDLFKHYGQ